MVKKKLYKDGGSFKIIIGRKELPKKEVGDYTEIELLEELEHDTKLRMG